MKKLLPLILLLAGTGAGVGAGIFMRPEPEMLESSSEVEEPASDKKGEDLEENTATKEYVKMNNQFVVPIIKQDKVQSLVVMSLSIEVPAGEKEAVYAQEPKLRNSFLQVLFDHANIGGFDGEFTNTGRLSTLRNSLREVAQRDIGDVVRDILIIEIARQDY